MFLRIIAYILNALLLILGGLTFMRGGCCGGTVAVLAGLFNLSVLFQGSLEGAWGMTGLACNVVVIGQGLLNGWLAFDIFRGNVPQELATAPQSAVTILAAILTGMTIVCIGAGTVTLTILAREVMPKD